MTSDDHLADRVARELSGPEPSVHYGTSLVVATLIASPVLVAGAMGRQSVPVALALYLVALVVVWIVAGFVGGALALSPRDRLVPAPVEPSPPQTADSVGSHGAH